MNHPIRTLSVALLLAASAMTAQAQTNPLSSSSSMSRSPIESARMKPLFHATAPTTPGQVSPVPEPSEWSMMLAGMALVGFMVRRNSKRS